MTREPFLPAAARDRLRAERELLGLSLADLAVRIGRTTRGHISHCEHGRDQPSPEFLERWAAALGLAVVWPGPLRVVPRRAKPGEPRNRRNPKSPIPNPQSEIGHFPPQSPAADSGCSSQPGSSRRRKAKR